MVSEPSQAQQDRAAQAWSHGVSIRADQNRAGPVQANRRRAKAEPSYAGPS